MKFVIAAVLFAHGIGHVMGPLQVFKVAVINPAIGGTQLRQNLVLMPRWLQQAPEPDDPNRPDNLWESVAGDFGAHGRFDGSAHDSSLQLVAAEHRRALALTGLAAAGALWAWRRR